MEPNSANFLNKIMEMMIMQMFNNPNKDSTVSCSNRICTDKKKKCRKRRKHHRNCRKNRSRCPTDEVPSIICVAKCVKKCKKTRKKTKCPNPCTRRRKNLSDRLACDSSDNSDSAAKYCSKCGQPLPGVNVQQKSSPSRPNWYRGTHSKIHGNQISSPAETCISCHTVETCTPCQKSQPIRSNQNVGGQGVPDSALFSTPFFLENVSDPKPDDLRGGYKKNDLGSSGLEKQNDYLLQGNRFDKVDVSKPSGLKSYFPPPENNSNYPTTVRIKRCGENIITVKCVEGGDNSGRHVEEENCENSENFQGEKTQCSRRIIQITEDQRIDHGGSRITEVQRADFSSVTCGEKPSSATDVPCSGSSRAPEMKNMGYGPCSDRSKPAFHTVPASGNRHTVRMKFTQPGHHLDTSPRDISCCNIHGYSDTTKAVIYPVADNGELNCVDQPSCSCCDQTTSRPPVRTFCYDPTNHQYDDDTYDLPCRYTGEPAASYYPPPPPPIYRQPYEHQPVQRQDSSESTSASTQSEHPSDGYDFFYGTVKPSKTPNGGKRSSNKSK